MSLNVTVVTWDYVACATDRRLTNGNGVLSERSNKLIQVICKTAHCLITYNGIGSAPNGETPRDWISDIDDLGNLTLEGLADRIKNLSELKIPTLSAAFGGNPRHSFVLSAFENGTPVLGMISNYESLLDAEPAKTARASMSVELLSPKERTSVGAYAITGATHIVRRRSKDALTEALNARQSSTTMLSLMTKIIRDTSYVERRRGSVGSSVISSILKPGLGFEAGGGVVGGTKVHEIPDMLSPGAKFRDGWISTNPVGEPFESRYDPIRKRFDIPEPRCGACGTPVPAGYLRCGACDQPV